MLERRPQEKADRVPKSEESLAALDRFDFVSAYETHTAELLSLTEDKRSALERAIGSGSPEEFVAIGSMQRDLLLAYGLRRDSFIVEIGCGAGRLAVHLSDWLKGTYVGTDVVQPLLDQAAAIASGPHMRFEHVAGLTVPVEAECADMVCAFSVFTHLLHEESYSYLQECHRVLRPGGGRVIFSFLEYKVPSHWGIMESNLASIGERGVLNQFMSVDAVETWAEHLGFQIINICRGDRPFIPLSRPVTVNGYLYSRVGSFGQSAAILVKP